MEQMYADKESFLGGILGGADMNCQSVLCYVLVAVLVVVLVVMLLWLGRRIWCMVKGTCSESLAMRGRCCSKPNLMTLRTVEFPAGGNCNDCDCGSGCAKIQGACCDGSQLMGTAANVADNVYPGRYAGGCGVGAVESAGLQAGVDNFDLAVANAPGPGNQVCACVRPYAKPCSSNMYDERSLRNLVDYKA